MADKRRATDILSTVVGKRLAIFSLQINSKSVILRLFVVEGGKQTSEVASLSCEIPTTMATLSCCWFILSQLNILGCSHGQADGNSK